MAVGITTDLVQYAVGTGTNITTNSITFLPYTWYYVVVHVGSSLVTSIGISGGGITWNTLMPADPRVSWSTAVFCGYCEPHQGGTAGITITKNTTGDTACLVESVGRVVNTGTPNGAYTYTTTLGQTVATATTQRYHVQVSTSSSRLATMTSSGFTAVTTATFNSALIQTWFKPSVTGGTVTTTTSVAVGRTGIGVGTGNFTEVTAMPYVCMADM